MSQIIVKFKKPADVDTRTEQAVSFICDLFGFASPWFNDDTWFEDDRRTLVIGSGYNDTDVKRKISDLKIIYEGEISEIYEETDDDDACDVPHKYLALIPFTTKRPLDDDDIHALTIDFVSKTEHIYGVEIERCQIRDAEVKE